MNSITTWLAENKIAASLAAFFLVAAGVLGWFTYMAWADYGTAQNDYASEASQLTKLSQKKPFPSETNLNKLRDTFARDESDLSKLTKELQRYRIPFFAQIDKAKPQDMPQQFQDALRNEVTKIKSLAADSGVTLPPKFYLGLDEYENKVPQQEDTLSLAKQLSVISWIAETVAGKKGLILAEFERVQPGSLKNDATRRGLPASTPSKDYKTSVTIRLSFRCNQGSLREIVNSISASPYFLIIDDIQIQNTSVEPPRRAVVAQGTEASHDDTGVVQRLPIIVGRELLNISMKVRALEFQDSLQPQVPESQSSLKNQINGQ